MNTPLPTGFLILRTAGFALGGVASGYLSATLIEELSLESLPNFDLLPIHRCSWLPGLVYAVFLLAVVLLQGPLRMHGRPGKRWWWLILLPLGSMTAYYVAFFTSMHSVPRLGDLFPTSGILPYMIGGFAGGIPGSIGLLLTLTPVLRSLDRTYARIVYVLLGGTLGTLLGVIPLSDMASAGFWTDSEDFVLSTFFIGWQGGMMMALSLFDGLDPGRTQSALE